MDLTMRHTTDIIVWNPTSNRIMALVSPFVCIDGSSHDKTVLSFGLPITDQGPKKNIIGLWGTIVQGTATISNINTVPSCKYSYAFVDLNIPQHDIGIYCRDRRYSQLL